MALQEAVRQPRVHVEGDRLDCEGGIDAAVLERARALGRAAGRASAGLNLYFGGANAVSVERGRPAGRRPATRAATATGIVL